MRILQNRHVAWLVRIRAFALATAALIVGCGTASSVQHVALNDPPSPLSNSKTIAAHAKLLFSVVPQPRLIVRDSGYYVWKSTTTISMPSPMPHAILDALVTVLKDHSIAGSVNGRRKRQADIKLQIDPVRGQNLGPEGYALAITPNSITATANAQSGLFYAVQTLDQLILNHGNAVVSPTIRIRDWPRFRWRGIHLDVSRHFFPVDVVKRYISVAAHYKLNTFQWHLVDDEGWRLPIRHFPLLTASALCSANCGHYTDDQIRDVVSYAKQRFVSIVPEIEFPGHSGAAIKAYPELSCGGSPASEVYCPTEFTFEFMADVLSDVANLFPGRFIHIGGDEVSNRSMARCRNPDTYAPAPGLPPVWWTLS